MAIAVREGYLSPVTMARPVIGFVLVALILCDCCVFQRVAKDIIFLKGGKNNDIQWLDDEIDKSNQTTT